MQSSVHTILVVAGWVFLLGGLLLDLVSCFWATSSRVGRGARSRVLIVPIVLYAVGLAAHGRVFFPYAFLDLVVLAALHASLQFVVPGVVAALWRPGLG